MDIIYRERANGRFEYWTIIESYRYYLSEAKARRDVARGLARLVIIK